MKYRHPNAQKKVDRITRNFQRSLRLPEPDGPDLHINNQGTIILFTPLTQKAKDWIAENVQEGATYYGPALVVEHRYASELAKGMLDAGLKGS